MSYQPYAIQEKFHKSLKKFRGFIGGLGSGKTLCGACESLQVALDFPGSLGIILAPTYPMLRDSTIKTFLEVCPPDLIREYNRSEQRLVLINNSEIMFRPGNDAAAIDRLRNINVDWFWVDEASLFLEYAWKVLVGRLRGRTGPRRGWVTTTPKGYNWTWRKFVSEPTKDYEYFTASSLDNPYLPPDYKESLQAEYTGIFARQEILGLFVGFEGSVYPEFNRTTHVIDTAGMKFEAIIAGVDFGFTNPSVILKIGIDYDGRLYVLEEFYERHVTDAALAAWAKENMKDVEFFIADSENPSAIQEFQNLDMDCKGVKKVVAEPKETFVISGIKRITNLLIIRGDGKPRLYVDRKCVNTIMEFENYRYPEKEENSPLKEAPLKIHDHCLRWDTRITTDKEEKRIKDVKAGDMVLTRKGYRKVLKSGITLRNQGLIRTFFSNGSFIDSTSDHPIFTQDKGFIPMDALRYAYILEGINSDLWKRSRKLSTKASSSGGILTTGTTGREYGQRKKELCRFTGRFGRTIMGRFIKDMTSITKTAIRIIMSCPISNACLKEFTTLNVTEDALREKESISMRYARLPANGTARKRESDGIKGMVEGLGRIARHLKESVRFVANVSSVILREPDTVRAVARLRLSATEDVYDLTVEGEHEFYANGILVHNSMDALRYIVTTLGEEFDRIIYLEGEQNETKKG